MAKIKIDYLTKNDIKDKGDVFEAAIEALKEGKCKLDKGGCICSLILPSGEKILASAIIDYCNQIRRFDYQETIDICEAIRQIMPRGFDDISYSLGLWITRVTLNWFDLEKTSANYVSAWKLRADYDKSHVNHDFVKLMCYVAVCLIKYGASYESGTANMYFDMVNQLGFDDVKYLKKHGTGTLPADVVAYKDDNVVCKANDVFATIDINIKNECEDAYSKALDFVNTLLKHEFPKSFAIKFRSRVKAFLPIKGLPKKGVNNFFNNAVKYTGLYPKIEKYAKLAMNEYEWYIDLEDENCAMPSTFAVFALGLASDKYFALVKKYMETCDDEHQGMQLKFIPYFVEKYGVTKSSLPVIVSSFLSYQSTGPTKKTTEAFANNEALNLLSDLKNNPDKYGFGKKDFERYYWDVIKYCIFGRNASKTIKDFPADCRQLATEIAR